MAEHEVQLTIGEMTVRARPDCAYTPDGLWIALDEDRGTARVGLTDFCQRSNGEVAYVELPERGMACDAGDELASIETVNADLSISVPFAGTILALNEQLAQSPELINEDPYGRGWLAELRPAQWPPCGLLDADAYLRLVLRQSAAARGVA